MESLNGNKIGCEGRSRKKQTGPEHRSKKERVEEGYLVIYSVCISRTIREGVVEGKW